MGSCSGNNMPFLVLSIMGFMQQVEFCIIQLNLREVLC